MSPSAWILVVGLLSSSSSALAPAFELKKPARVYQLPDELVEISALTDVDERTVACLHDEAATLYFLDLTSGEVVRKLPFGAPGDMEGLTRVGVEYFALRSDGLIYRMTIGAAGATVGDTFRLSLPETNIEGLGYDEKKGLILISPKGFVKGAKETRDKRSIHAYDPKEMELLAAPALTLSVTEVIRQARAAGFAVPMRTTDNGREVPALKLRFSSVAVDPVSDHYYLLSAVDRALLVVDRSGRLVELDQLDPKLFPKPEGITFLPSGDMLISNEGKGTRPNILRFTRK